MYKFILALLLLFSSSAFADEIYLNLNIASKHFDQGYRQPSEGQLNEANTGCGIEYDSGDSRQLYGVYKNSIGRNAVYAAYAYTPLHDEHISLGFIGGLATGYKVSVVPIFGWIATVQINRVGVNIIIVPFMNGYIGIQGRLRIN